MTSTVFNRHRSKLGLIFLAYIAFISLGLPDGLLGVAWPSIRANFSLPLDALGVLLIGGTTGYLTSSFFSGRVMARLGVGGLLAASCALTGASLLGYTLVPAWWMMIALGFIAGLGAGAIDAGINAYMAANFSEGLMQWLHASFGVGITMGPIIMTTGLNVFDSWRFGYVVVGAAQLVLAVGFAFTMSMWKQGGQPASDKQDQNLLEYKTALWDTLQQPGAWVSILLFFLYTGIELTLGHWVYTLLTESRNIAPAAAGLWAGSYWGTFTVGRVIAGLFTRRIGVANLVRYSMMAALAGALLLWWNPSEVVSLIGVAGTGFAIAPIFPGLVSGTRARVGARHTTNTIGIQISAAGFGVMVLPGLAGALARRTSLEAIPVFLVALIFTLLVLYLLSLRRKSPEA